MSKQPASVQGGVKNSTGKVETIERPDWYDGMMEEAYDRATKIKRARIDADKYARYRHDYVGFCRDILGDKFTPEVEEVVYSVENNAVTEAQSANAIGKSLPVFTPIPTPTGWKAIGDLKVGDCVFGDDGQPTTVVGVFPQGVQPTYRVAFNDDTTILASADHLWAVRSSSRQHRELPYEIYTTKDLESMAGKHFHIPMCNPVEYPTADLPIPPYTLGVLIGDGSITKFATVTSEDKFIRDRVTTECEQVGFRTNSYKNGNLAIQDRPGLPNRFITTLRKLDLLGCKSEDKFIPRQYLTSSIKQRVDLLHGLFDTDGYIGETHSIVYTTVSELLALDVRELVWSLGGTAKIRRKKTAYIAQDGTKKTGLLAYNLYIKMPLCPFSLPKKTERYIPEDRLQKQAQRLIDSVEYVGNMESVCIRVDNPRGLFLAEHYTVTHNSFAAARIGLAFYLTWPDAQVYITAAPPERNLTDNIWAHIAHIQYKKPAIFSGHHTSRMKISRHKLSFIEGVTIPTTGTKEERQAKFSGRHAPHLLFIVDEGDAVPEEIFLGIESCMSSEYVRLLILFNPRAPQGIVFEKARTSKAKVVEISAFSHPNVAQGIDVIPGAVSREVTVRRINEWTRPLAFEEKSDNDCFEVPEFLVGCTAQSQDGTPFPPLQAGWRKVVNAEFWYMVLGKYPPQGSSQLIAQEWVDAAINRRKNYVAIYGDIPPANIRPILGIDCAEYGGDNNLCCARYGGFVGQLRRWAGLDADQNSDYAWKLYKEYDAASVMVDALGVGASVAPKMSRLSVEEKWRSPSTGEPAVIFGVKVSEKPSKMTSSDLGDFFSIRDEIYWRVREWLRLDPTAMLPDDKLLKEELLALTYDNVTLNGKIKVVSKDKLRDQLKRSTDSADGLALTFAPFERATVRRIQ